jgi:hypothetical protein
LKQVFEEDFLPFPLASVIGHLSCVSKNKGNMAGGPIADNH